MITQSFPNRIRELVDEINSSSGSLGVTAGAFKALSGPSPSYTCSEAGFLRAVSWLYTLYYEAGRSSFEFLVSYLPVYSLDETEELRFHYSAIHDLRTVLQHGLQYGRARDGAIQNIADRWLISKCNAPDPAADYQWRACLAGILGDATSFLQAILSVVDRIGRDDFRDGIVAEWNYRCARLRPPEEFDQLIRIVATDLGQGHIDATRLRKRYYDSWMKDLELVRGNLDFATEARKFIERTLLSRAVLPITGEDVIRELNIKPGPEVGRVLRRAQVIFESNPCSRQLLLEQLCSEGAAPFERDTGI